MRLPSLRSPWALLVLVLVVVKGTLVLTLGDVFFYGEELEKGVAAKAMLDGLDVPHHQLAYHYYEGGGFVISHCTALAFLVVGQNILAHKLVALGFQVAILLSGCLFMRRFFSRGAALWFGLLLIFGPESYQKLSLISLGIHFEACLFMLGVLGLGARILFGEATRARDWFLLGLVTGVGLYFSYQVALAAAWVALVLLLFRRRELLGLRGLCGVLGTLVGALPLLVMVRLVGSAVFDIHGASVTGGGNGVGNSVLLREYLVSIFIDGDLGSTVAPLLWAALTLCAIVFLARTRELPGPPDGASPRAVAAYLFGYMIFFLGLYLCSGFVQGRVSHFFLLLRLVPIWMLAVMLIAAALGELSGSGQRFGRNLALALGTLLIATGVRADLSIIDRGHPRSLGKNWSILTGHKGYTYDQYLAKVLGHFEGSRVEKLALLESLDESAPGLLRADAVESLYSAAFLAECGGDVRVAWSTARAELQDLAGEDAARLEQYELGLGALLVLGHQWNRRAAFDSVLQVPAEVRAPIFEALGRYGGEGYPLAENLHRAAAPALGIESAGPYLRGLGRWAYSIRRLDPDSFIAELAGYPELAARQMHAGFEAERRWNMLP